MSTAVPALDFFVDARRPAARTLDVVLEFDRDALGPAAGGTAVDENAVELFLAVWTPGSYLVREYARQLSRVEAEDANTGAPLAIAKTTKNRWRINAAGAATRIRVRYSVYAHELTVRTADVTAAHAYWNQACVLLWPVDRPALPARLAVAMPDGWDAECALLATKPPAGSDATVAWSIRDLDEAIDSPCLLGAFERLEFEARGVRHVVALDGLDGIRPPARFVADLTAIVDAAADVFGGALPYDDYAFLCLFTDRGYGGLEHNNSCTLLMDRTAFSPRSSSQYRQFLGLCAHELFHVWNVKRMRPRELWEFDYENENYTRMLWLAEGWTAYYDDLLVRRAGCVAVEHYLAVVERNIERVLANPGRQALSLAESSFDAWIRLYRPDENTRNSSQNYYVNGAVAAMCLDLAIRRRSAGERSLDDVLRRLWQTFEAGRGYELADVDAAIAEVAGPDEVELLRELTQGPLDPPCVDALAAIGITCTIDRGSKPQLGVTFKANTTELASITDDTPAARAGLHPGDEIIGMAGLRTTSALWRDVFAAVARVGEPLTLTIARRGVLQELVVTPEPTTAKVGLELASDATPEQVALRDGWLCTAIKTRSDDDM